MSEPNENIQAAAARSQSIIEYERERFTIQKCFAEYLCSKNRPKAKTWKKLIRRASDTTRKGFADGRPSGITEAVRKAEEILGPLVSEAKTYTIRCVGHAHIDMNWMWSWPETVNTVNDTFTTVLRLMKEFPEFRFSQSQAAVYRIIETFNPDMLREIRKKVRTGQWEVTASHWVEGDRNIAGSEALCRHLLCSRRYIQKLFGLSPEDVPVDWAPDTFGHARTVPSILTKGGVRYCYLHRPGAHTPPQPKPEVFRWRGPDGSEILVKNDMHVGYNADLRPGMITDVLMREAEATGLKTALLVYGVGNHGGGPTRRHLMVRRDLDSWPVYPRVICSSAKEYFEEIEKENRKFPVVDDELNFEFTGCYTSQTLIKKANRYSEKKLADAETVSALIRACTGKKYDSAGFEARWRDALFLHFHDILPGSGVHDTRTHAHGLFQEITAFTSVREAEALRCLAALVDTSCADTEVPDGLMPGKYPRGMGAGVGHGTENGGVTQYGFGRGSDRKAFIIYNSLPYERNEIAEVTVWDPGWGWEERDMNTVPWRVKCPDGTYIKAQVLDSGNFWGHAFIKLAFPVHIPPFGYSLYIAEEGEAQETGLPARLTGIRHQCSYGWYERGPEGLDNGLTHAELNMKDGGLSLLKDSVQGTVCVRPEHPAPILQYAVERPREMSAWIIEHTNEWSGMKPDRISRGHKGPYIASMDAQGVIGNSNFTITYTLKADDPALYISISGNWHEIGDNVKGSPVLRFSLPLSLSGLKGTYEIPFGSIERDMKNGEEVPALRWTWAQGEAGQKKAGVLLLNDSKHGHSIDGKHLNLTLIRSTYSPDPLPEVGKHNIHLALVPTGGKLSTARATEAARVFNHELKIINTDAHKGTLPPEQSFISMESSNAVLESLKKSETDDALIMRLYNPSSRKCRAGIIVSTLLGKVIKAAETDLLERVLDADTTEVSGNRVTVQVPKRGITTLKIHLERE